jgi:mRNA interferase HigB
MLPKWKLKGQGVHVISKSPFTAAARKYPTANSALTLLYRQLCKDDFASPDELKCLYPSLDRMKYRDKWWVIDVLGNHIRVLFFADFERGKIFIKHICSHSEYDKLIKKYRESRQ